MVQQKTKKGAVTAFAAAAVFLGFIILLENLSLLLPSVPNVLLPTSQLFSVLKKAAVYSLAAVSMNLLNGFTGLFSLGQALCCWGRIPMQFCPSLWLTGRPSITSTAARR